MFQRGELAAHRAQSNPDLKEMLLNAVNMYTELSSLGGANSQPGSQATSPMVEKDSAFKVLATPMAQIESLSDKDGSSDELTNELSTKGSENANEYDNETGSKVSSKAEVPPEKNSKDESVNSLSDSLDQKVNLNVNEHSLSPPTESYGEAANLIDGHSQGVALETAKAANEPLCDTSDATRTVTEDRCSEKLDASEKSSNGGNISHGEENVSKTG